VKLEFFAWYWSWWWWWWWWWTNHRGQLSLLSLCGLLKWWSVDACVLHSWHEITELLQWLCHHDSTVNIGFSIIIITIFIIGGSCAVCLIVVWGVSNHRLMHGCYSCCTQTMTISSVWRLAFCVNWLLRRKVLMSLREKTLERGYLTSCILAMRQSVGLVVFVQYIMTDQFCVDLQVFHSF